MTMFALVFLAMAQGEKPAFEFDVRSGAGLTVRVAGVPVIRGSWFQYYAPGWTKGYYSSNWGAQQVRRIDADTVEVTFRGADGKATGSETLHREGLTLKAHYRFEWAGDDPARIEVTPGMIWAPAFESGSLTADGKPTRPLDAVSYRSKSDLTERRFSADATRYELSAPLTNVDIRSSVPMTLFDGRGYTQDWAEREPIWWHGALGRDVAKGQPVELDVEWRFAPNPPAPDRKETVQLTRSALAAASAPDESLPILIPKPKKATLDFDHPVELTGVYRFPAGRVRYWNDFLAAVARRFEAPPKGTKPVKVDGGASKLELQPGGYTIDVAAGSISVLGQEDEGLKYGMLRLAQLVFARNGRLWLPSGRLTDEPQIAWRGVHLFVGPEARPFQRKLWERVLLPLGMNKVVLQCERTEWKSTPLDPSTHPMSRQEMAHLFEDYRGMDVEPIPLIQSFGHMEWFFDGKRRLDLAQNPSVPYAVDPRKPGTRTALNALWDEAIDLLKPKTIHFGCDEVDMLGVEPHDPALTTELWGQQLPFLGTIAKRHGVSMMIWGDKALAPGEAPDAALGDTQGDAEKRRAAIPQGTTIADWHYKADPRPEAFYPTLQLWKREGFRPIGAAWYRPENIRGVDLAAYLERVGTLQTTWAGYESSERAMVENLNQFSAMVLAADYSWSGRQEPLSELGYEPGEVFRKMYFGHPSPVRSSPGAAFTPPGPSHAARIGSVNFSLGNPIAMRSVLVAGQADAPTEIGIPLGQPRKSLTLALDTARATTEGEEVAILEGTLANGQKVRKRLVYGHHVRAQSDTAIVPYAERAAGICAVPFELEAGQRIVRLTIRVTSRTAGLRLYGLTTGA